MKIQYILILLLLLLNNSFLSAHSGKARYHVIVETDGHSTDLRTISLLLASKEVEVIGIYCSQEENETSEVEYAVRSMLAEYHHEGVDVGSSYEFLKRVYHSEDEDITYVCLTSLRSLAEVICTDPQMKEKTVQVIRFAHESLAATGVNQQFLPQDYSKIKECDLPLIQLSYKTDSVVAIDVEFIRKAGMIESRYAMQIRGFHQNTPISEELTAIYLHDPDIFQEMESRAYPGSKVYCPDSPNAVSAAYFEMLKEKTPDYKILSHIPLEADYYQDDIAGIMDTVITKYGESEWRAAVICFELHGHIGIYAIIGVKMGLRAREYFNIGLDDLYIESHAGLNPPFSCLNDGLQVSTGSSLGHGLIHAESTSAPAVSATFSFKGRSVLISLKQSIVNKMKQDILECIQKDGMLTPEYWATVRKLALEYWSEYDRNQIFTLIEKN